MLAAELIDSGVPLLIEKPLAQRLGEVDALIAASTARGVPITCGFVERFNPAVQTAMSLLDEPVLHVLALRHSPPAPRITVNVVHDLLIHDIDLALMLMNGEVISSVVSASCTPGWSELAEIADCTIGFASGAVATVSASRASQRKVRTIRISSESTLLELDLMAQTVMLYRHVGHELVDIESRRSYRAQTIMDVPFVRRSGEPLAMQWSHFLDILAGRSDASANLNSLRAPHEVADAVLESASSR
jgi:predicted dehydrogenase